MRYVHLSRGQLRSYPERQFQAERAKEGAQVCVPLWIYIPFQNHRWRKRASYM